jgi:hypothetical protein
METTVAVWITRSALPAGRASALLQLGVACPARTPTTVQEFLTQQLGMSTDYVRDRIATIFVDGMVVDDPEEAIVRDGGTVSLSAAMPGLVGAALRKGGYYAPMRSEINWRPPEDDAPQERTSDGVVRVRLFNLILREQGAAVLARGIIMSRQDLIDVLEEPEREPADRPAGDSVVLRVVDRSTSGSRSESECV